MAAIFSQNGPGAQRIRPQERLERLASVTPERKAEALQFLAGFDPGTFDAVLDAVEPVDDNDDPDASEEAEPFCVSCGESLGIFLRFGLGWRHFRGDGEFGLEHIEVFDAGHEPVLAWRSDEVTGVR